MTTINITREKGTIVTYTDFRDIESRGEIAHVVMELEVIKKELEQRWINFGKEDKDNEEDLED